MPAWLLSSLEVRPLVKAQGFPHARVFAEHGHLRSGYTKRSKVENSFHRYKAILGREMKARTLAGQRVEARLGCRILNTMASLGMPESYRVA